LHTVEDFAPEVIVAPLQTALALADQKVWGLMELQSLRVALVVLTRVAPMEQHDRDLLWRAFGVPVFEQLRDSDGVVIARECEVHDGLHLVENAAGPTVEIELVTGHCECGAETPRIRKLAPVRQRAAAAAA
jgi:phenylacetate-coenzyme A ligase PaaK-like adenylate-forming protein